MTLGGDPTPEESVVVEDTWNRFAETFPGFEDCIGPLEVRVVEHAENVYGSAFPIAAFYQFPPEAKIFVEHGKVSPRVLLHEIAHHLDISCDLGEGPVGERFRAAQGIPANRGWLSGSSWSSVPAEMFAEAVVAFMGGEPKIPITQEALEIVAELSHIPERAVVERNLAEVAAAVAGLRALTPGQMPEIAPAETPVAV
jgi:hypothetical protein